MFQGPAIAAKTLGHVITNITNVLQEGVDLLRHDHTQADIDKWEEHCKEVFKDTDESAAKGAESAAKDQVSRGLELKGYSKEQIIEMVNHQWQRIESLAEIVRKESLRTWKEKLLWRGFVTFATGAFVIGGWQLITQPRPMTQEEKDYRAFVAHQEYIEKTAEQNSEMLRNMDSYIQGMRDVAAAPAPVLPEELPATVAAVADIPVAVEIETPDAAPEEATLTVGQVYRNATPQAQRQIERDVPKIQHDYDKPSVTSCVVTDCLNQHRDEWNRKINELNQHKEWSVTMGDGSSKIHVAY